MPQETATVSVRLKQAEIERIGALAAQLGLERSALLRKALRRGCDDFLFEEACARYRRGEVSTSKAAELAGVGLRDFLARLGPAGGELNLTVADVQADLAP